MKAWGITSGSAGMAAQVKALATALDIPIEMKTVSLRTPFVYLPNALFSGLLGNYVTAVLQGDSVAPPYPDIIISCGRRSAAVAMGLKVKAPDTKFIHIQDPQVSSRHFDVVVAMEHDRINGLNVIKAKSALHAITPARLEEARQHFAPRFAAYGKPVYAALIGGTTNKYTLSKEGMARVVMALQRVLQHNEGSLLITPSRRTGDDNIAMLKSAFANNPRAYVYDMVEENPYMAMLALADTLIVTNDSVNMMSEAQATGKPIYLIELPGHEDTKPSRFGERLVEEGVARPLSKTLESWSYDAPDEMDHIAAEVKKKL